MDVRDRIQGLVRVKASELKGAPWNWRTHSDGQRQALGGSITELGIVDALNARRLPDGSLEIFDGHARRDWFDQVTPDTLIPVLISDLNEAEAKKANALLDPISAMADTDGAALAKLLQEVTSENADVTKLLADLSREANGIAELTEEATPAGPSGMELDPHEHYDFLVVLCSTAQDWNMLCEKLDMVPTNRRGKIGTCRAIRAERLLPLLGAKK